MTQSTKIGRRILMGLAGLAAAALLATAAWNGYRAVATQPFQRAIFAGAVDRLPHGELDALAHAIQAANTSSLAAVREAARRVPWVREATVRRVFPDTVEITFEAHEAFARWNEAQLVSTRGEVFTAPGAATLPRLRGPDGSAAAMVEEYPRLLARAAPLGSAIAELRLSPRGAWQAVLETGLVLELGRGDIHSRLERFAAAWPQVREVETRHADLRYPNGFALRRGADPARKPAAAPAARSNPEQQR